MATGTKHLHIKLLRLPNHWHTTLKPNYANMKHKEVRQGYGKGDITSMEAQIINNNNTIIKLEPTGFLNASNEGLCMESCDVDFKSDIPESYNDRSVTSMSSYKHSQNVKSMEVSSASESEKFCLKALNDIENKSSRNEPGDTSVTEKQNLNLIGSSHLLDSTTLDQCVSDDRPEEVNKDRYLEDNWLLDRRTGDDICDIPDLIIDESSTCGDFTGHDQLSNEMEICEKIDLKNHGDIDEGERLPVTCMHKDAMWGGKKVHDSEPCHAFTWYGMQTSPVMNTSDIIEEESKASLPTYQYEGDDGQFGAQQESETTTQIVNNIKRSSGTSFSADSNDSMTSLPEISGDSPSHLVIEKVVSLSETPKTDQHEELNTGHCIFLTTAELNKSSEPYNNDSQSQNSSAGSPKDERMYENDNGGQSGSEQSESEKVSDTSKENYIHDPPLPTVCLSEVVLKLAKRVSKSLIQIEGEENATTVADIVMKDTLLEKKDGHVTRNSKIASKQKTMRRKLQISQRKLRQHNENCRVRPAKRMRHSPLSSKIQRVKPRMKKTVAIARKTFNLRRRPTVQVDRLWPVHQIKRSRKTHKGLQAKKLSLTRANHKRESLPNTSVGVLTLKKISKNRKFKGDSKEDKNKAGNERRKHVKLTKRKSESDEDRSLKKKKVPTATLR